ncbi:hypothetical protein ABT186_29870 [Streptomyces sp. NPDC001634]
MNGELVTGSSHLVELLGAAGCGMEVASAPAGAGPVAWPTPGRPR